MSLKPKHLALAAFFLLAVLPLLAGLAYSLLFSLGLAGILGKGFTLIHWQNFFISPEAFVSFVYSFCLSSVTIGLAGGLALMLVLTLSHPLRYGCLSFLIYLPLGVPAMVAAFFTFQLLAKAGWISRLSYALGLTSGIQDFPDLVQDPAGIGIVAAHLMLALAFFVLLFLNLSQRERIPELTQLAQSLGGSRWQATLKVALPILVQKARPTLLLYGIFVMGSYEIPLLLGRQSPQMVSVFTLRQLRHFNLQNQPQAYISALVFTLLLMGIALLVFRKKRWSL